MGVKIMDQEIKEYIDEKFDEVDERFDEVIAVIHFLQDKIKF